MGATGRLSNNEKAGSCVGDAIAISMFGFLSTWIARLPTHRIVVSELISRWLKTPRQFTASP
jgi:hypothetical protein